VDPADRLHAAHAAAAEGRYEEALREYIWFHDHALKHQPSLYGVRLSFALSYWIELGKVYPKARRALEKIRARKSGALRGGRKDRNLFFDVAAINQYLKRERDTYRLFRTLDAAAPRFAQKCASLAIPAILEAGDFALARRYTPDPDAELERAAEILNGGIAAVRRPRSPVREAYIENYCGHVKQLIAVLEGAGEASRARAIRKSALKRVGSAAVRKAVAARLRR
jgi:hypothetical protein